MTDTTPLAKYERLTGLSGNRLAAWISEVFDVGEKTMYRWQREGWPRYTLVVADVLSKIPKENWPNTVRRPFEQ